jgi:hypothetical protein
LSAIVVVVVKRGILEKRIHRLCEPKEPEKKWYHTSATLKSWYESRGVPTPK